MSTAQLDHLAIEWQRAKAAEQAANAARVGIEEQIVALTTKPTEGSLTVKTEAYKFTVKQGITRKLDEKAYALIVDKIPESIRPVTWEQKAKVDAAGVRWLQNHEPGYFKLLATALTETPAKPSITVEAVK